MRLLICFALTILAAAFGVSYLLEWRDDIRRGPP